MRTLPIWLLTLLLVSCATYRPKYGKDYRPFQAKDKEVTHTFYLIGDAGKSPEGAMNPTLQNFKGHLDKANKNSTAIFLGDNIYPAGLPDKKDKSYKKAKHYLDAQLATLENYKGRKLFIPGNHDWYANGLEGLKRQEKYIEKALDEKDVFLPENGCPIEKVKISDDIMLLVVDSEWFLVNWDKHPTINDDCEIKDREAFFEEIEGQIKKNLDKTILIALHHPMLTYGNHGGQYSFIQQFFPSSNKIPLPVLGTVANVLRKTTGVSIEDQQNKRYNQLKKRMLAIAQYSDRVVFISGHEHTLQFIREENTPQIVSGSGAKKGATRLLGGSEYSTGQRGYAILKVYKDGSSSVAYFTTENGIEKPDFSIEVFPKKEKESTFESDVTSYPQTQKASVYTEEEVDKSGFFKTIWGARYRDYYGTKVEAPVVFLDTLYGGLTPVRKGGGHQSKSLRLQHADGRQFVMRAIRKSAELYLQSLLFKDQYVTGELKGTATEKLLLDFYTGSHPYAPFVLGPLSDAASLYHTNTILYYIPKQPQLGSFNSEFGDELYMLEEHVSEGHDLPSFGYAEKIVSTTDLLEKMRKDEDNVVDTKTYIRARLFDMLIGDWDRHPDQWRWAEFKQKSGKKIYKPIPRDRDQAFSIMGDGALMKLATRTVPSLSLFEGFQEKFRSVKGFNGSPMTVALDMTLLGQTTREDWLNEAAFLMNNITPEVVSQTMALFPPEVADATTQNLGPTLLRRKETLREVAKEYYTMLSQYPVITGTDKDDFFEINYLDNERLSLKVYRIKNGQKADLIFHRIFEKGMTKELWIYGLDDDDVFEVSGISNEIKVRMAGGQNNDIYKVAKGITGVHIYDFKDKKNTYDAVKGGKVHAIRDYDTNTFQFLNLKSSTNQLLPNLGFNPDDGIQLGFVNSYLKNGFRKNPFTQKHTFSAGFFFATNGLDVKYHGEFAHFFEGVNLELGARFTTPNFAVNFFGFGNETQNNDEDLGHDFNRVRVRIISFDPKLVWRGYLGSKFSLGASFENYQIENTEDRFIEDFYQNAGRSAEQSFLGLKAAYEYSNYDDQAFPTLGMTIKLAGGYVSNLSESGREFSYLMPSFAITHPISTNKKLVLASKVAGQINFGNDFEFYQGAHLGARNGLRGYRFQRFTGKRSFYQTTDIRWSLRRQKTGILPVTPGFYTGFDYGRVWLSGESSNTWHQSFGGGLFVNGSGLMTANLGLFSSDDGLRFTFGFGFGF